MRYLSAFLVISIFKLFFRYWYMYTYRDTIKRLSFLRGIVLFMMLKNIQFPFFQAFFKQPTLSFTQEVFSKSRNGHPIGRGSEMYSVERWHSKDVLGKTHGEKKVWCAWEGSSEHVWVLAMESSRISNYWLAWGTELASCLLKPWVDSWIYWSSITVFFHPPHQLSSLYSFQMSSPHLQWLMCHRTGKSLVGIRRNIIFLEHK